MAGMGRDMLFCLSELLLTEAFTDSGSYSTRVTRDRFSAIMRISQSNALSDPPACSYILFQRERMYS